MHNDVTRSWSSGKSFHRILSVSSLGIHCFSGLQFSYAYTLIVLMNRQHTEPIPCKSVILSNKSSLQNLHQYYGCIVVLHFNNDYNYFVLHYTLYRIFYMDRCFGARNKQVMMATTKIITLQYIF